MCNTMLLVFRMKLKVTLANKLYPSTHISLLLKYPYRMYINMG